MPMFCDKAGVGDAFSQNIRNIATKKQIIGAIGFGNLLLILELVTILWSFLWR